MTKFKWVHIGGDLEASYDGSRYVDIRARSSETSLSRSKPDKNLVFLSKQALLNVMKLFPKK